MRNARNGDKRNLRLGLKSDNLNNTHLTNNKKQLAPPYPGVARPSGVVPQVTCGLGHAAPALGCGRNGFGVEWQPDASWFMLCRALWGKEFWLCSCCRKEKGRAVEYRDPECNLYDSGTRLKPLRGKIVHIGRLRVTRVVTLELYVPADRAFEFLEVQLDRQGPAQGIQSEPESSRKAPKSDEMTPPLKSRMQNPARSLDPNSSSQSLCLEISNYAIQLTTGRRGTGQREQATSGGGALASDGVPYLAKAPVAESSLCHTREATTNHLRKKL
ncbi:hypothetical protein C8R43DRAFT_959787 [Mycena crocata]|nr:hypothetical protein C8R43DRAFT_959787 [Mycena crocata]